MTTRTLQNLKGQIIYFGSPLNFNDPYDCALTPNFKSATDAEVEEIRGAYLRDGRVARAMRAEFEAFSTQQLREMLLRVADSVIRSSIEEFFRTRGVACFSERNDDLLMWSHYGGRYKGICLEFSTSHEPFQSIRQVRYLPSPPSLDIRTLVLERDFKDVFQLFCTKFLAWQYEKEWRALHKVAGTALVYKPEALTGVYFGPDIDQESLEIACLVLSGQNEHVRFWRGSRSTTEFKVLFQEFSYTSHIDAKRKGLLGIARPM